MFSFLKSNSLLYKIRNYIIWSCSRITIKKKAHIFY